ncbi:MAG: methionyl-tRNA formyltransferase [Candidatus Pacebacteria bacterium]|nr:methionyl-tRNA formyltransferase [Candidatus Paceibacterota bacterium]MCF7857168.1 methionyl-tRNA formyltransferase [Candidatus Paceibacterota bacterium]
MNNKINPTVAFFGSSQISVWVLEELEKEGILPSLVITNPDTRQGRKMILTETPVAQWAQQKSIATFKPASLRNEEIVATLKASGCDLFIVAAYGKMIPEEILNIPRFKTLNMHPSLLPKLRGASPIRSAILEDVHPTGVSIMILTKGLDEGPILAQEETQIEDSEWPIKGTVLDEILAHQGGKLLAKTIHTWVSGNMQPQEQNHEEATYSQKITKEMGEIDFSNDPYKNLLRIRAFDGWPGAFFFVERKGALVRIKILDALIQDGVLVPTKIIPEGKKEMLYEDFLRSQ